MHYFRVKSEIRIDQASRHTERHFSVLREIITDRFLNLNPLRESLSNDTSNCSGGTTKVQIDDDLRREATSNDNTGRKWRSCTKCVGIITPGKAQTAEG